MARSYKLVNIIVPSASSGTSSGVMTLIGTNTQSSLLTNPSYSGRFNAAGTADGLPFQTYSLGYALNGAYGSGAFVPGYRGKGCWMVASASGDTAPRVWDAVLFDFNSKSWEVQTNAHGIKNHLTADHYPLSGSETWAQPWSTDGKFETTNFPGVPHPSQQYRGTVGVGAKYIITAGAYAGAGGVGTSGWAHQYDPSTRTYSLFSANAIDSSLWPISDWMKEAVALYDATANRIWLVTYEVWSTTKQLYLDLNDNTWKAATIPPGPFTGNSGNYHHALLHDDGTRRCILRFKNDSANGNYVYVLDLTNIGAGWRPCTLSGSLANFGQRTYIQPFGVRWAQYPSSAGGDDCHYTTDGYSRTITKIAPPASGITGTWTITTITPSSIVNDTGASYPLTFPDAMAGGGIAENGSTLPHCTRFFWVPGLSCFAWVAGGDKAVALWKP